VHGASYNPGMRQDVASLLLRINLEFYQTFAGPFAATRRRLQPGVVRALRSVQSEASVLDLGCGAAELARGLRYIHLFTHDDLQALATQVGLVVVDRYRSDGDAGQAQEHPA